MTDASMSYTEYEQLTDWLRVVGFETATTAAEQTAAALMSRSFVSAEVRGRHSFLFTPERLATMAQELVLQGQTIWRLNGDLIWVRQAHVISRGPNRGSYSINGKPCDTRKILHVRLNINMIDGMGRSDLGMALAMQSFIRNLEGHVFKEATGAHGYVIPTEQWSNEKLQTGLKKLGGKRMMVDSDTKNFMGSPVSSHARDEWNQRRLGFDAPENVRLWYESMHSTALSIMGVPPALYSPDADASAMREAWRLYIFTVVDPMAKILEGAAKRCNLEIDLNFDRLMASDVANRARAYGSLVDAGMDEAQAERVTGF